MYSREGRGGPPLWELKKPVYDVFRGWKERTEKEVDGRYPSRKMQVAHIQKQSWPCLKALEDQGIWRLLRGLFSFQRNQRHFWPFRIFHGVGDEWLLRFT